VYKVKRKADGSFFVRYKLK